MSGPDLRDADRRLARDGSETIAGPSLARDADLLVARASGSALLRAVSSSFFSSSPAPSVGGLSLRERDRAGLALGERAFFDTDGALGGGGVGCRGATGSGASGSDMGSGGGIWTTG